MMTDPIADMLTRLRNAVLSRKPKVEIPASKLKMEILRVLKEEGYIQNFKLTPEPRPGSIRVFMKREVQGSSIISGIARVSRPGCRIYCGKNEIPRVYGGLGINILSTPKGVMTGRRALKEGVGGEILCNVW
jgi:small subunit ribosomal protein S8